MTQEICHGSDERLERYAMDQLSGVGLDNLEEHLLICQTCQVRLDETEAYVHAMRRSLTALRKAPTPASMLDNLCDTIRAGLRLSSTLGFAGAFAFLALVCGISTQWPRKGTTALSEEPLTVRLEAMKREAKNSVANRPLQLLLDGRGLPTASRYRLQIVDQTGKSVWEGIAASDSPEQLLRANVGKPLGFGRYFVRIFANETVSEPAREFDLRVRQIQ